MEGVRQELGTDRLDWSFAVGGAQDADRGWYVADRRRSAGRGVAEPRTRSFHLARMKVSLDRWASATSMVPTAIARAAPGRGGRGRAAPCSVRRSRSEDVVIGVGVGLGDFTIA